MAALEADADFQVLFLGLFCCCENAADADGIERHGFFHEDVFPLFDGLFKHHGTEGAGGREDHDIARGDRLFVALEAEEDAFLGDVDACAVLNGEVLEGFLDFLFKEFSDGDEFDVGAGFERLVGSAGGTSAAAHHGEFEGAIFFCGVGEPFDGECGEGRSDGCGFEEVSSGELVGVVHVDGDLR